MADRTPADYHAILAQLEETLEAEFTFIRCEDLSQRLCACLHDDRRFVLDWTRRAAATNTELAFQFANRALEMLGDVEREVIAAWCLHAMDSYDRAGLVRAMSVIRDLEGFLALGYQRANGSLNNPVLIIRRGSALIFLLGNSKQDDRRNARGLGLRRLLHEEINRPSKLSRHRGNWLLSPFPPGNK